MIAETGVGVARVDLFWTDIAPERPADPTDPADPAYDWDKADYIFSNYAANGIDTIVSAYNTPEWAMREGAVASGTRINNAFPDPDDYADFMTAVARRYSGDYQPEGADEPLPEITHYEIWNEPNFRSFLGEGRETCTSITSSSPPAADDSPSPDLSGLLPAPPPARWVQILIPM